MTASLPCPCCGFLTLTDPDSCEVCPICFWEKDPNQGRSPGIDQIPPPPNLHGLEPGSRAIQIRTAKIALLALVRGIESGHMPLFEGCAAIAGLVHATTTREPLDESMVTFIAVASEIDDIPFGAVRKEWSAEALAAMDCRLMEYEARIRPAVMKACSQLEAALLAELRGSMSGGSKVEA